jgi:hypothetical protein
VHRRAREREQTTPTSCSPPGGAPGGLLGDGQTTVKEIEMVAAIELEAARASGKGRGVAAASFI